MAENLTTGLSGSELFQSLNERGEWRIAATDFAFIRNGAGTLQGLLASPSNSLGSRATRAICSMDCNTRRAVEDEQEAGDEHASAGVWTEKAKDQIICH